MNGTNLQDLPSCNHKLLDEICPPTLAEMRAKDGLGSDNMTILVIDLLKHKGGSRALTKSKTM